MTPEIRVLVYAGPSLPPWARPNHPAFDWRAPTRAGDALEVLENLDARPTTLVLIDGLFDAAPAIRHKELLMLVGRGVRVIGAASMGALRAAELHGHGMEGVGRIFAAYAAGRLTRDDEVALLHGPAETGWNALTEPLVNVRATLAKAVRHRVLSPDAARRLRATASRMHFAVRTWQALRRAHEGEADLQVLAAWVAENRVDLKRQDALACLDAALTPSSTTPPQIMPPATMFTDALARTRSQDQAAASIWRKPSFSLPASASDRIGC